MNSGSELQPGCRTTARSGQVRLECGVATEAGNSVAQIDKHYRYPLTPADGKEWFGQLPGAA